MSKLRKFNKNENIGLKKALIIVSICLVLSLVISATMTYAVYQKEVEIPFINARVGEFTVNDIELAMLLDGEQVEVPPSKDNYIVDISCDNADGSWDSDRWGANIDNIRAGKVKCEVNFSTPKPTLSEVTASFSKTSINLGYTMSGINTHATCKYGKEEGNYNTIVEEVANTNCNITGLEEKKIYYYQVCAVNGGGEDCKTGNVKTGATVLDLKVGDYISMTPTATSYTISKDLTGHTSNQTINPSELNLWRVISKNADGTVDMVSEYVSSEVVYFQGKTGYINHIKALNTIAAQYTDGKHVARTRHIGYSNQTETITDVSMLNQLSKPWTKSTNPYSVYNKNCDSDEYLCGVDEQRGAGDIGFVGDYNLVHSLYGTIRGHNPEGNEQAYFLSSRLYWVGSYGYYFFDVRVAVGDAQAGHTSLHYNSSNGISSGYSGAGVRPIITIKADTQIISGDGKSAETAYQLI